MLYSRTLTNGFSLHMYFNAPHAIRGSVVKGMSKGRKDSCLFQLSRHPASSAGERTPSGAARGSWNDGIDHTDLLLLAESNVFRRVVSS